MPSPKEKPKTPSAKFILYGLAFLALIIGLYFGYQNIKDLNVDETTNTAVVPVKGTSGQPATTCPATSCETSLGCCGDLRHTDNVVAPGVGSSSASNYVLVDQSCDCPSDTNLTDASYWVPGYSVPLKYCTCNNNV